MTAIAVAMPRELDEAVREHLFQSKVEQVAFLLARFANDEFVVEDLMRIPRDGFDYQSAVHVSLSDNERARVIKWAWDKGGSLIETHVHLFEEPAALSPTDLGGLHEFVPHIWWRLRGRPYAALVYGPDSFDGLAWISSADNAQQISKIRTADGIERPATARSLEKWKKPLGPDD